MSTDAPAPPAPSASEGDGASLPPGLRINEYLIERTLGGGGFGITYLARDSNLQLPVAIKEYYPGELASRGANHSVRVRGGSAEQQEQYDWGLERFLDEARALATFRHPNIVRVLRYFRENGTAYIVMEYESGLSLKRWVPQNAPLSQRDLLAIVYPLLDGLESVHKTGFLHRDIKPDNIYVRADNTPVLLDFGAARRVTANKDMTNIVSPGFAPFEQYHSRGNQGPWTDIYSLGAVMYWMTTGKKPLESASRVKQDSMLPASSLAEASVYGAALLQAIDWAMQPDEGQRPQTVAAFRAAILGSEKLEPGDAGATPRDASTVAAAGSALSVPGGPVSGGTGTSGSSGAVRHNLLCTIMFLDLVGYSVRSVDDQVAIKKLFNDMLARALKGVPEDSRIAIDTGDGAAICFMGDPEEALRSAMLLRDLLGQRRAILQVRIGLHMGPVRVVSDINERVNVVGDGINVAQRIMDFAQGNQVLVSRSYYDVISRITDGTADLFQYMGQYEDKHGRLHEIYAVATQRGAADATRRDGAGHMETQPLRVRAHAPLDAGEVHDVEVELARHIGPLARVLVRKAQPLAASIEALRHALAPTIQEPKAREAFMSGSSSHGHSGPSHPPSHPPSQPAPVSPGPIRTAATRSVPASKGLEIPANELAIIEQTLSKYIGPMARMLVRKETSRAGSYRELVKAIADNIDQAAQREQFIVALKRALPRRDR
jgi:serine/threonine protein kinase